MGLFSTFVDRVMAKKIEDVTVRAERAGKLGVDTARKHCPVRTGRLRRSISFTWSQSTHVLTLIASEPYAAHVEARSHFMAAGWKAMSSAFKGGTSVVQFDTLPEKYHGRARLFKKNPPGTVFGHRRR